MSCVQCVAFLRSCFGRLQGFFGWCGAELLAVMGIPWAVQLLLWSLGLALAQPGTESGGAASSGGTDWRCPRAPLSADNVSWFLAAPLWTDIENVVIAWEQMPPAGWTEEDEYVTSKAADEARAKAKLLLKWADLAGKLREGRDLKKGGLPSREVSSSSDGSSAEDELPVVPADEPGSGEKEAMAAEAAAGLSEHGDDLVGQHERGWEDRYHRPLDAPYPVQQGVTPGNILQAWNRRQWVSHWGSTEPGSLARAVVSLVRYAGRRKTFSQRFHNELVLNGAEFTTWSTLGDVAGELRIPPAEVLAAILGTQHVAKLALLCEVHGKAGPVPAEVWIGSGEVVRTGHGHQWLGNWPWFSGMDGTYQMEPRCWRAALVRVFTPALEGGDDNERRAFFGAGGDEEEVEGASSCAAVQRPYTLWPEKTGQSQAAAVVPAAGDHDHGQAQSDNKWAYAVGKPFLSFNKESDFQKSGQARQQAQIASWKAAEKRSTWSQQPEPAHVEGVWAPEDQTGQSAASNAAVAGATLAVGQVAGVAVAEPPTDERKMAAKAAAEGRKKEQKEQNAEEKKTKAKSEHKESASASQPPAEAPAAKRPRTQEKEGGKDKRKDDPAGRKDKDKGKEKKEKRKVKDIDLVE